MSERGNHKSTNLGDDQFWFCSLSIPANGIGHKLSLPSLMLFSLPAWFTFHLSKFTIGFSYLWSKIIVYLANFYRGERGRIHKTFFFLWNLQNFTAKFNVCRWRVWCHDTYQKDTHINAIYHHSKIKSLTIPANTTLGCKGLPGTNTVAYLAHTKVSICDINFLNFYIWQVQNFKILKLSAWNWNFAVKFQNH